MVEMVKTLCKAFGPPGQEAAVVELIEKSIAGHCQHRRDAFGNMIAVKKGQAPAAQKVMLLAQLDELGFFVSRITKDGCLKLEPTGMFDPNVLVGGSVLVQGKKGLLPGVVGAKPVHLQSKDEQAQGVRAEDLVLDIGCGSEAEAQNLVTLGAGVSFWPECEEFGRGMLKTKAGQRLGCAVLAKLICEFNEFGFCAAFCGAGQVTEAGAMLAAKEEQPDIAIVVGSAEAQDTPAGGKNGTCCLNVGPVVSFMDKGAVYDQELVNMALGAAAESNLMVQRSKSVGQSSRLAQVYSSGTGVKTLAVNLPVRYLQTAGCLVSVFDLEQTVELLKVILRKTAGGN